MHTVLLAFKEPNAPPPKKKLYMEKASGEVANQTTIFSNQNHYNHRSLHEIIGVTLTTSDNRSYLWETYCTANISTEKKTNIFYHIPSADPKYSIK